MFNSVEYFRSQENLILVKIDEELIRLEKNNSHWHERHISLVNEIEEDKKRKIEDVLPFLNKDLHQNCFKTETQICKLKSIKRTLIKVEKENQSILDALINEIISYGSNLFNSTCQMSNMAKTYELEIMCCLIRI